MKSLCAAALLLLALSLGCGTAATGLATDGPPGGVRAIHITQAGVELPSHLNVGALGSHRFDIVLEDAGGNRIPRGERTVTWGSTNPGVADAAMQAGRGDIFVNRNGEARIIAHLDGLRDTVVLQVTQVAVVGRVIADTIVTLSRGARNLSGAPSAYHAFRYAAIRVDSNGYSAPAAEPLRFAIGAGTPFEVVPELPSDTIAVLGIDPGAGYLITLFGEAADTVPVQVADAYRVVRLIETPSGQLRTLPDTTRIPAGAAVVFQNETRSTVRVDSFGSQENNWTSGAIPPNGRRARILTKPGLHLYSWNGAPAVVIVTP